MGRLLVQSAPMMLFGDRRTWNLPHVSDTLERSHQSVWSSSMECLHGLTPSYQLQSMLTSKHKVLDLSVPQNRRSCFALGWQCQRLYSSSSPTFSVSSHPLACGHLRFYLPSKLSPLSLVPNSWAAIHSFPLASGS